jgi:hypothetical protein
MTSALFFTGVCMNGCAFGNSASWKEEVLLHDGRTIIVKRSQTYGGYSEPASKERSVILEDWVFPIPGTEQDIRWSVDMRTPPAGSSLLLITLGFVDGIPYIATRPAGCIAYNYWGRPNPPYVFFKYIGTQWQRIALTDYPRELTEANVVVGGRPNPQKQSGNTLSIAKIKEENRLLEPHLKRIVREPLSVKQAEVIGCPKEIYDGNGRWLGIDWFTSQPSYEACLEFCKRKKISEPYCPCNDIFKNGGR